MTSDTKQVRATVNKAEWLDLKTTPGESDTATLQRLISLYRRMLEIDADPMVAVGRCLQCLTPQAAVEVPTIKATALPEPFAAAVDVDAAPGNSYDSIGSADDF